MGLTREAVVEANVSKAFTYEKFLTEGLDTFFNARKSTEPDRKEIPTLPSDYWTQIEFKGGKGFDGELVLPSDERGISIYSKEVFPYPTVSVKTTLPDFSEVPDDKDARAYVGIEAGSAAGTGLAAFRYSRVGGVSKLEASLWGTHLEPTVDLDITGRLPSDYQTTRHVYTVQATKNMVLFYIDQDIVAYGVISPNSEFPKISAPPYGLLASNTPVATYNSPFLELSNGASLETTWNIAPYHTRFGPSPPLPSLKQPLYDNGADTLLTSGTYDTGTSHKSHPVPVWGYNNKSIYFRADTDSTTDGLSVEILTAEGNWRTYATRTLTANELEVINLAGTTPLVRIGYEPSADGASITDAEVAMT